MKLKTVTSLALITALAALISGCASSTQTAQKSGFLDDYSELRAGDENEAQYVYIDHRADFTQYTKVKIAPVTVWAGASEMTEIDPEEAQALANYLHTAIHNELKQDYEIVETTGPDTLLIRVALTEAIGANRTLNSISTVIPVGLVISAGKKVATGTHAFVGKASIEVEVLDSATGQRLAAAVDERAGAKGVEAEWTQVEKAFDFWAGKMRNRLERLTTASRLKQNLLDVKI